MPRQRHTPTNVPRVIKSISPLPRIWHSCMNHRAPSAATPNAAKAKDTTACHSRPATISAGTPINPTVPTAAQAKSGIERRCATICEVPYTIAAIPSNTNPQRIRTHRTYVPTKAKEGKNTNKPINITMKLAKPMKHTTRSMPSFVDAESRLSAPPEPIRCPLHQLRHPKRTHTQCITRGHPCFISPLLPLCRIQPPRLNR